MPTAKQSAASRANAQKSTGPRTPAGKAASRYNAQKHGIHAKQQIMFDETEEALAELTAEYHEEHAPANPTERMLVDTLIHNEWRLRRMRVVEATLWDTAGDEYLGAHPEFKNCNSAHVFSHSSSVFERLQRVVNSCERNYHRALKALKAAQADPARSPQPEQSIPASEPSASFGNIPENPPSDPPIPLCASASLPQNAPLEADPPTIGQ